MSMGVHAVLDEVHTPRNMPYTMPSDDSQLDALEHSLDVTAVQNSLAHMSMPHNAVRNARRPQANSPGIHHITSGVCCVMWPALNPTLHVLNHADVDPRDRAACAATDYPRKLAFTLITSFAFTDFVLCATCIPS